MKIRDKEFDFKKKTYVMGILNVTPDSFSDGGLHNTTDAALEHAKKMIADGAAIIDVGGESTRPGYTPVSADEEIQRVIPVIEAIRKASDIAVSIDTTKAEVAEEAIKAGADIVNSVAGLATDEKMFEVVRSQGVVFVMTYENSYVNQFDRSLVSMAEHAVNAGIDPGKIIIDPGVGFGKSFEDNLRIINELPFITQTDYPVLLGCSRKSVIGNVLGVRADERLSGTIVTTVLAALAGVGIVRVHDVKENLEAIKMLTAICEV